MCNGIYAFHFQTSTMSRVHVSIVTEDVPSGSDRGIVSRTLELSILEGAIHSMYAVFSARFRFLTFEDSNVCLRQLAMSRFFMACLWLMSHNASRKRIRKLMRVCAHVRLKCVAILTSRRVAVCIQSTPDVWWFCDENGLVDLCVQFRNLGDYTVSHQCAYEQRPGTCF